MVKNIAINFLAVKVGGAKTYYNQFLRFVQSPEFEKTSDGICLHVFTPYEVDLKIKNVKFYTKKYSNILHRLILEFIFLPFWCQRLKCEVGYFPGDIVSPWGKFKKVMLVRNANLYLTNKYEDKLLSKLRMSVLRKISRLSLKLAHEVIFVSDSIKKMAANFVNVDQKKTLILPHGVERKIITFENLDAHPSFKLKPYILCVSSIYYYKNYEDVIEAFAKVSSDKFQYLLIAGAIIETKYYDKLVKFVEHLGLKDRVIFLGEVKNEKDLSSYYQNSDLCVVSSTLESFGNAPFESLSQGIPTIISRIPVFEEFLGKLKAPQIMFYKPHDIDGLVGLINHSKTIQKNQVDLQMLNWSENFTKLMTILKSN